MSIGRESYIRLLAEGYRAIKHPIPEWLQRELDGLPPLPESEPISLPDGFLDALVFAIGQKADIQLHADPPLTPAGVGASGYATGKFTAHNMPWSDTVTHVQLRKEDGTVLLTMPLNASSVVAGDSLTVFIDGLALS